MDAPSYAKYKGFFFLQYTIKKMKNKKSNEEKAQADPCAKVDAKIDEQQVTCF